MFENELGSDDDEGEIDFSLLGYSYLSATCGIGTPLQTAGNYFLSTTSLDTIMTGEGCPSSSCGVAAYDYTKSSTAIPDGVCSFARG